jgi:hypothetical protein
MQARRARAPRACDLGRAAASARRPVAARRQLRCCAARARCRELQAQTSVTGVTAHRGKGQVDGARSASLLASGMGSRAGGGTPPAEARPAAPRRTTRRPRRTGTAGSTCSLRTPGCRLPGAPQRRVSLQPPPAVSTAGSGLPGTPGSRPPPSTPAALTASTSGRSAADATPAGADSAAEGRCSC